MSDIEKSEHAIDGESEKCLPEQQQERDSGWAWVIVFSAFAINIITDGCSFSFGVLFSHLLDEFQETRSATAWTGSLLASAPMLCGPIASWITTKIGFRKATIIGGLIAVAGYLASAFVYSIDAICLTLGCITGVGISLPYLNSIVVVTSYFEKKRTIATGISQSGAGIGTLIFSPLYEFLIEKYGWRGALIIMGGIVLNIVACGAVFRQIDKHIPIEDIEMAHSASGSESKNEEDENIHCLTNTKCVEKIENVATCNYIKEKEGSLYKKTKWYRFMEKKMDILCNRRFFILTLAFILVYFFYDVPYDFTIDRMKGLGVAEQKSTYIMAVIGLFHVIGNVVFGILGNRNQTHRIFLFSGSLVLWGVVLFVIPSFTQYVPNMILGGMFGFISACQEAVHAVIIIDILGEDKMTDAYGILMFIQGMSNLFGPPFGGKIY